MNESIPKIIWMYWEDRPFSSKPEYLKLCAETIEKHRGDYELRLLSNSTVEDYIALPRKVRKFKKIAHKADYIRFMILHEYGGVWLDADLVLLQDIGAAIEPYINGFDFLSYGVEPGKPHINFMACKPASVIVSNHIEDMLAHIDELEMPRFGGKISLSWTGIGNEIIWPIAQKNPYFHHPLNRVAPLFWKQWEEFLQSTTGLDVLLENDPFMVMLYNDFMVKPLQRKSRSQLLNGDMLLSKLFRHALE